MSADISLDVILFMFLLFFLFLVYVYAQWKLKETERYLGYVAVLKNDSREAEINTLQQEDIFNISGRVQNQENQWNAHDAYLSIEHIAATHQMNKTPHGDAPPSYEEAMRLAIAASVESAQPTAASPRAVSPTTTPPPPPPPQTENATVASTATETTVVVEPPKPSSS